MKYLIIPPEKKSAFATDYYEYENNYDEGMIVVALFNATISFNGKDFHKIEEDHL